MKKVFFLLIYLASSIYLFAQPSDGDYESRSDGNWNSVDTWSVYNAGSWHNLDDPGAGSYQNVIPSSSSGIITIGDILNNLFHTITIPDGYSATADQLEIETISQLVVADGGQLTISTVSGDIEFTDPIGLSSSYGVLTVQSNGILINGNVINTPDAGSLILNSSSTYQHAQDGGTIPLATWDSNSNCEITGNTGGSINNLDQTFGNFIWNATGFISTFNLDQNLSTNQDLIIRRTGTIGNFRFTSTSTGINISIGRDFIIENSAIVQFTQSGSATINVSRDFIYTSSGSSSISFDGGQITINTTGNFEQSSGTLSFLNGSATTGTAILNVDGDFSFTGGTITESATSSSVSGEINFENSGLQTYTDGGTFLNQINFTVKSGSILDLGTSPLTGEGNFLLESSGELRVGNTNSSGAIQSGTTNGNIRVSGSRVYTSGSTIAYNGIAKQYIGNGHPSTPGVNTIIDNTSGVDLATNITIGSDLTLTNGNLSLVGNNLTISGALVMSNGNISVGASTLTLESSITPGSNTISVTSNSNLILNGNNITGIFPFPAGNQTINNLTLNRSEGNLAINSTLTINGACTLNAGDLIFNDHTLRLAGTYSTTAGALSGNSSSVLEIASSGALGQLEFTSNGNAIDSLKFTSGSASLDGALTVNVLRLSNGTFTNISGFMMADGGTIRRNATGSYLGARPISGTGDSYNVVYTGTLTTGNELPDPAVTDDQDNLNNLTILNGPVTLNQTLYINGTVTLAGSSFNNGANTIHMLGSNWTKTLGSFTPGSGSVVFESPGGTTIGGGNPNLGNIQLISTAGLTFPSATINISGNVQFDAGATFNANGGTVNLNGDSDQIISAGGLLFQDITVDKDGGVVNLSGPLNLAGKLELISASDFQSQGYLTIISTSDGISGNGHIATIPAGAQVSGDVTVQRYMSGEGKIYRYLSSPVTNASVASWQDDFPITGTFDDPSTGPGIASGNPSLYFYDETNTSPVTDDGWTLYPESGLAMNNPLQVGLGYAAYVREASASTIVDVTGPVNQGNINLPVNYTSSGNPSADGWNLVGNPFPATIDWDTPGGWTKSSLNGAIAVKDNGGGGGFRYWNGDDLGDILENGYIAAGQAFWVQANNMGTPQLEVNENAKVNSTGEFYRKDNFVANHLIVSLSDGTINDKTHIVFSEDALDEFDSQYDCYKLNNTLFDLSSISVDGYKMAINYLAMPVVKKHIKLDVSDIENLTSYNLSVSGLESFENVYEFTLYDHYLNKSYDLKEINNISFQSNSDEGSFGPERFELIIDPGFEDDGLSPRCDLIVFPNPARNFVNILFKNPDRHNYRDFKSRFGRPGGFMKSWKEQNDDEVTYRIYSISSGALVKYGTLEEFHNQYKAYVELDGNFPRGIYLVEVNDGENNYYTKFVKK